MNILVSRPIITEKSMKCANNNLYTFAVAASATKLQIAKFIAEKFSVKVLSVKVINVKGRAKKQRKVRGTYLTSGVRKAMVQLETGQKIGLFEPKENESEVKVTTAEDTNVKEKRSILKGTKVKIEKIADAPSQSNQRKVITGK